MRILNEPSRRVLLLGVWIVLSSGCSVELKRRDWSSYDGPGAEYLQREEYPFPLGVADPVEPFNRGTGAFNHGVIVGVIDPLARVYTFVLPGFVRAGVRNFGRNLSYPRNLVTNLLQAKWGGAGDETLRFLTNTTLGIGGLFDPATAFGVQPSRSDFGLTFGKWGWEPNFYLTLPFYGPGNDRDLVGEVADTATEPLTYLTPMLQLWSNMIPVSGIFRFNDLTGTLDTYRNFVRVQYDPYQTSRVMWSVIRLARDPVYAEGLTDHTSAPVQTLQSILFEPRDPKFAGRAEWRSVEIPATGAELPYNLWKQPAPAPLAFILPGIGGHRLSNSTAALAEMAYREGFSVVAISSTMNWEFMETASSMAVPGYAPADAREVRGALEAIYSQLVAEHPDTFLSTMLMGLSFGGFHTLFIAASEGETQGSPLQFDRYVAVVPPVRLMHGMEVIDAYYNRPLELPEEERDAWVENILVKIAALLEGGFQPEKGLPLDRLEAEFVIGASFRLIAMDVIHSSQRRHDLGVLETELTDFSRANAYREISEYSLLEYFYAFVYPYLKETDVEIQTAADVVRRCDLRSIERALKRNRKIRVFPNRNDFLYAPRDLVWLERVFGDRLHVFADGGHMGNLHREDVQARIAEAFADLAP